MILDLSIRHAAEHIEVCVKTSFYMRHRLLDAIRLDTGMGALKWMKHLSLSHSKEIMKKKQLD